MATHIQSSVDFQGTGGTCFPALPGVTAGNDVLVIAWAGGGTLSIDDLNYTKIFDRDEGAGGGRVCGFYRAGVPTGGALSFTVTATVGNPQASIHEFNAMGTYAASTTPMNEAFTGSASTPSYAPTAGQGLLGVVINLSAETVTSWSIGTEIADDPRARTISVALYTAPNTSSVTFTATMSSAAYCMAFILAFTPAPVADPIFPPLSRVPGRTPTAPPDVYFWVEPPVVVVAPFMGQATQVPHGRPPVAPQVIGEAPVVLQGELPLPPTAPPVVPRRAPSTPLETYQWPGLSALDPHIGDYPVAPWTAATGVPKAGVWRPVGVVESQVPPVAVVEPPPGQAHVGRGAPHAPEGGTWATFWNPPDVAVPLPPGASEGGVPPSRLPVRGLVELSVRVAQTLLGELPPGRAAQAGGRAGGRGPVAWDLPSTLLFAIVLPPPPAQSGTGGAPRSAPQRGRTTLWSWSGYIPVPATPMPPGVQRGPFAGKGHGHAPVSPYHAAYVISLPPALFGPAELWQFPDGTTLYTFGGDEPVAWAFQADRIIWEW